MAGVGQNTFESWYLAAKNDSNIIPVNQPGKTVTPVPTGGHTIWPGACTDTPGLSYYEYSTTADVGYVVSSSVNDTGPLVIDSLRGDGSRVSVTVPALAGTTPVALPEAIMQPNFGSYVTGNNIGRISVLTSDDVTAGVPNVDSDVKMVIEPGEGLSKQAVYRVPLGYICSLLGGYVQLFETSGASTTAEVAWGGAANLSGTVVGGFLNFGDLEISTTHYRHDEDYLVPESVPELSTVEVRCMGTSGASVALRCRVFAWLVNKNA